MVQRKRFLAFTLIVGGLGLGGCTSRASVAGRSARGASSARLNQTQASSKAAGREASFSVYNNPEYGVAFRYPRNYALVEGALEEGAPEEAVADVKSQEEIEREQPGAILLATVAVPQDAYPNTTFVDGSVQLVVNPSLTSESCRDLVISRAGDTGSTTIQGVLFAWEQDATAAEDTKLLERDYAGFSNGACYEFFVRVAVGEAEGGDGLEKPADAEKIVRHLERIVSSAQIGAKRGASGGEKAPE